jgi:Histidine-specific methyltransferase, SAM-dependent
MPSDDRHFVEKLQQVIEDSDFEWSLQLIAEDPTHKLATLTADLSGRPSNTGDGKQITSGFAYWGTAPTIAWSAACNDRFYPVMQQSIESFSGRWKRVRSKLDSVPYHYVSLGIGTGQKDGVILPDLLGVQPKLLYVPVDLSAAMLRIGVRESARSVNLAPTQMLPVQLDFAIRDNMAELRALLQRLIGDEPVLYSLLGNTLANFDDDVELLRTLTSQLRPQDRFLLEVATTDALDDDLADAAAEEYHHSRAYQEFVTSALMMYTDLTINMDSVLYRGSVEGERALLVKVIYQNRTGADLRFILPDRTKVAFPDRDTIRLYLSRKYTRRGLDGMLGAVGVEKLQGIHSGFTQQRSPRAFGTDLLLLAAGDRVPEQRATKADEIWSNFRT